MKQNDEEALRQCLEGARDALGEAAAIAEVARSRVPLNTSYDTYLVQVRWAGGGELRLFLKDFGTSLRPKNAPRQRREREVRAYREVLADAGLGTARYAGSLLDEAAGRLWLLLEYVDGTPVGYTELGDGWAPAAAGLGRMHGHFARHLDGLRDREFLIRHDADFFWSAARQARADVAQVAPHLLGRLEALLRPYAAVVDVMIGQPRTLVQGGCRPSNILIRVASEPSRVCILDWEEAGIGAPLFDLAHLVDGIEPPLLDRLLEAYRQGAAEFGLASPPLREMRHAVHCFRLYMAFNSLGRSVLKGYRENDISKLLDYGDRVGHALFG